MIDTALALQLDAPRVGDRVGTPHDTLAEIAPRSPKSPRSWQLVPAGSAGKLVGWRDDERVAVAFDGLVFYVHVRSITRI
jgi:hypothetical protein